MSQAHYALILRRRQLSSEGDFYWGEFGGVLRVTTSRVLKSITKSGKEIRGCNSYGEQAVRYGHKGLVKVERETTALRLNNIMTAGQ
jgi:hypothetical protein